MAQDRFKILGGYSVFAYSSVNPQPTRGPLVLSPQDVEEFLTKSVDGFAYPGGGKVPLDSHLVCDFRTFLGTYHVGTVLSGPAPESRFAPNPRIVRQLYVEALGQPSQVDGPVSAWYSVAATVAATKLNYHCSAT